MKRLLRFIHISIIGLCVLACQSETLDLSNDRVALDVSIALDNGSRIAYNQDFVLNFSPNDRMDIMERSLMDVTSLYYNYDLKQFIGKIYVPRDADTYEVCTHIGAKSYTSEKAIFEISSNQIGSAGVYLAGVWELSNFQNLSLQMAQMSSMLAFTINPSEDGISEIILESAGGEMIAGTAEYDYSTHQYKVNGTSSKISIIPAVSPTKATQYVVNVLPVSLSKGAYLTIVDNKGKKMRLTLNYGTNFNFDINKVIILPDVINQKSFAMSLGKVYSSYTVDGVVTPNNELDGRTLWIESSNLYGLSTHLVKEAGYYVGDTKYQATLGSDGVISPMTFNNISLDSYQVKAYVIDNNGVVYYTQTKSVDVTGIPYTYSFTGASVNSIKGDGWNIVTPRAIEDNCVKMYNESYLTTPEFYSNESIDLIAIVGCASNESVGTTGLGNIYITNVAGDEIAPKNGTTIVPDYTMGWPGSAERVEKTSESFSITNEQSRVQFSTDAGTTIVLDKCYVLITDVTIKYAN